HDALPIFGAIAANGLRDEPVFDMAVYFYLHFQYNGWLTLILFGLFLFILERKNIAYREKWFTYSFWIYTISLFPGYFLSVLWHRSEERRVGKECRSRWSVYQ